MNGIGFIHQLKKYPIEMVLILLSLLSTGISLWLYLHAETSTPAVLASSHSKNDTESSPQITVDLSGAVIKPNIYSVKEGTHLKEVIESAGGLADDADTGYIARNFNMAKYVVDQEKIYVPFTWDITSGLFVEEAKMLSYLTPDGQPETSGINPSNQTISINSATLDELDALPGIGPVTAQKIIDGRPFTSIEDLLSHKILKSSIFEEIKQFITL